MTTPFQSLFLGTVILFLMGFGVVAFVVHYQRKQMKSQKVVQKLKAAHQMQLLGNSLAVQETVRRKISNDLHDEIGGLLSATKLSISTLSKMADPSMKIAVNNAKELVTEALSQVRSLSRDLIPRTLENFGMITAIEEFVQKMEAATQVKFQFVHENLKRYNPNLELTIYRVIQELTNNSLKHAEPSSIDIEIFELDDNLKIKFEDDGKGFDVDGVILAKNEGLGLDNIFSRLIVVDAIYAFNTNRKVGVEFSISIPIKN
jgi:signal transduction histidine kinase